MKNPIDVPKPLAKSPINLASHFVLLSIAGMLSLCCASSSARAGSFSSDFNSGVLPAGMAVYGVATNDLVGGFTNSGCIKLTTAAPSLIGSFVINDLDAGNPVVSFTATFKALVGGGTAADGFSFNFAPDLPLGTFAEEGAGSGLTVEFDTFKNDDPDTAPSIDVKVGGVEIAETSFPGLRANAFVDVVVQLHPDNTLDVIYDGAYAYSNLDISASGVFPMTGGLFGVGARTGGSTDNHFIDNLSISTQTNAAAFVDYFTPVGRSVRGDAPIKIILTDNATAADTSKLLLKLDGVTVVPTVTQTAPNTTVSYVPPSLFASASTHTVTLVWADNATPTPLTNTFEYGFTVATYSALATNLAADPSFANLGSPGFSIRYSQIADSGSRDVGRADSQLANLLIDTSTGLPFENLAAPNPDDSSFNFHETNVINYAFPSGGAAGNFAGDTDVPGIPGPSTGTGSSYAMAAVTYLHLSPGLYNLGVNSSDGFKLAIGDGPDIFAPQESIFNGVRASADTTVSFSVGRDGYYPFRLVYFTGDPTYNPAPGTSLPSVEFFNVDKNGNKVLVNDTNAFGYVPAFTAAKTRPYVRAISPGAGDTGVPGTAVVTATVVDGSLTVQTNTIQLLFNGNVVSPIVSSNSSVTTITYDPPGDLTPNSTNTVQLAFTDSGLNRRTNTWQFFAANIFQEIWNISPGAVPYVTTGSTERGLAYNPKTGHLILVSRAVGGLEIEVLNSSTGAKIGTMDKTGIAGGTFILNQIDVADDGVIYGSNLSTDSATSNLRIYRWANESAVPVMVYNDNPANPGNAGTTLYAMRIGDVLCVRRSGAGTQILMGQNSAISVAGNPDIGGGTNAVLFTTTDGTNFTAKRIPIQGISNGDIRLGLAFGCGDTLFGKQTGSPLRYAGFNPTAGTGALITTYNITNPISAATVGPLGFDIFNQRLIGNATSANAAQHSMNLYDNASLAASPTQNFPLDTRVFHTANTAFGTGAVDFSPDGTRVFALDTGNGIIAFSLNPKLAAPSICSQPQNFIAPIGNVGFFGVTAIGSPQTNQWRFHGTNLLSGTNIAGATNATLDLYYIQQSGLGYYSVVVGNSLGRQTSSLAYLDSTLVITNQPASQTVAIGGSATLQVGVSGGLPAMAYQWKLNGTNLSGATSSSLTINNAQVSNAGGYSVTITDVLGQSILSQVAVLTVGTVGTGTGLTGDYYSSHSSADPFSGVPTVSRLDPTVDFEWGTGSPDVNVTVDTFTVRWYGKVQPFYSQAYTFFTTTDDGTRLWVNGQTVIDSWINQAPTERSGSITLAANQKYDIVMEYFENAGGAGAHLSWSSPAQYKQIIPQTQLYPGTPPLIPVLTSGVLNGTNLVFRWSGTYNLESTSDLTPPATWTPVAGPIVSPYTNLIGSGQLFFRLRGTD